jgi:hypothetical protein
MEYMVFRIFCVFLRSGVIKTKIIIISGRIYSWGAEKLKFTISKFNRRIHFMIINTCFGSVTNITYSRTASILGWHMPFVNVIC